MQYMQYMQHLASMTQLEKLCNIPNMLRDAVTNKDTPLIRQLLLRVQFSNHQFYNNKTIILYYTLDYILDKSILITAVVNYQYDLLYKLQTQHNLYKCLSSNSGDDCFAYSYYENWKKEKGKEHNTTRLNS